MSLTETEKLCNRYDNVYFVRETEDCVNCLHSEFDPWTKNAYCLFQNMRIEMRRKMNAEARAKVQTKLLEFF